LDDWKKEEKITICIKKPMKIKIGFLNSTLEKFLMDPPLKYPRIKEIPIIIGINSTKLLPS